MTEFASPPRSPYLQLEFTAEEDIALSSDAEQKSDGPDQRRVSESNSTPSRGESRRGAGREVDARPLVSSVSTRTFFIALVLLMFVTSFACRGVVHGILRILQEDVDLSGGETITLALSFDFGFVIFVVVMALQDRKIHRPKSIGFGGFLIGVGLLVVCIPYVIIRSELKHGPWYVGKYDLCDGETASHQSGNSSTPGGGDGPAPKANWNSIAWMVIGLMLAGTGAVPQFPLGLTYLEDRLKGFGTPFYVAILLCSYLLGIWFGDLISFFMWHHVGNADNTTVALWWLGFFCSALVALVLGVFIFMAKDRYKRLVSETRGLIPGGANRTENGAQYRRLVSAEETPHRDGKVTPRWRRILTNSQLLCYGLGGSCEVALMTGFLIFLPRYIGTVTAAGRGPAKFYIGTAVITSLCFGILTSAGLTLSRKIKMKGLSLMALIGCVVALLFMWLLPIFQCSDAPIAGDIVKDGRHSPSEGTFNGFWTNLNATCNVDCICPKTFKSVCGSNGQTYLSPCLAGCHMEQPWDKIDSQGLKLTNFSECSCIPGQDGNGTNESLGQGYALSGPCPSACSNTWLFFAVVFIVFFLTGFQFGPMILISMRCVVRADRVAALSFHVSVWHLLGYVPAIAYFSAILNQSCVLWSSPDAQYYHECALYDSFKHQVYFLSTVLVLKVLSVVLHAAAFISIRRDRCVAGMDWADYDAIEMESADSVRSPSRTPAHL
ncbi:solute carrier organic anion transporter family member 5A1-like [Asterias amurensis]|uniref:solute carrier organic anion transporter family member 5A1-like n=1 Tax=Asterias amurensis TaxID=7602 RepID=UPI003AB85ADC